MRFADDARYLLHSRVQSCRLQHFLLLILNCDVSSFLTNVTHFIVNKYIKKMFVVWNHIITNIQFISLKLPMPIINNNLLHLSKSTFNN